MKQKTFNRRQIVHAGIALGAAPAWAASTEKIGTRTIPDSGEELPMVGLGTYQTFDVSGWPWEIYSRRTIVDRMIERGATVLDTSPQYEQSEETIGDVIGKDGRRDDLFLATKVWTDGEAAGRTQMQRSAELMQAEGRVDLMQVHNLRDTDIHMATIREWQQEGRIRYNGITHWLDEALPEMEAAMKKHRPQFIQIHYSLGERAAEERILPLARDMGIAVLVNRPYFRGRLFRAVSGQDLPDWAQEFANSWGQVFLKFILSHPAVTCVIPATSDSDHLDDNLDAGTGPMPDAAARDKIVEFMASR